MSRTAFVLLLLAVPAPADNPVPQSLRQFRVDDAIDSRHPVMLSFTPNGKNILATLPGSGMTSWVVATGKSDGNPFPPGYNRATITPDGKYLAAASYGRIRVHDVAGANEVGTLTISDYITCLALAADASLLATGGDSHLVELWDVKTSKQLHSLKGHDAYLSAVAFAPSGKLLASGAHDRTIRLWDVTTGKQQHVLEGHRDQVSTLAFLPDGKTLVSGSWDGTLRLWDVGTGKEKRCLKGHRLNVTALALDRAGKTLASASLDGTVRLWEVATGKERLTVEIDPDGVFTVALSPDGKTFAAGRPGERFSIHETATGKRLHLCSSDERARARAEMLLTRVEPSSVALSPNGQHIASGHADGGVRLWDATTGKMLRRLGLQTDYVWSAQFSPDGKHVASAGRRDGTVHVWDVDKGGQVKALTGQKGGISRVLWSRDGKRLVAAGGSFDPAIYLWDVEREKVIWRLEGHKEYIDDIALSWDEKTLASADRAGSLRLWDLVTGKEKDTTWVGTPGWTCVGFSPDDRTLAAGDSEGVVTLFDMDTGKQKYRLETPCARMNHVGFLRDGRTLVTAGTGGACLWETWTLTERWRLNVEGSYAGAAAVDPAGRRLVTANSAGVLHLWDPTGLSELGEKKGLLQRHWDDLAGTTGPAYRAIWQLSADPERVLPLFAKHARPVTGVDRERIERWVRDLGSDSFKVRNAAEQELEKLGDLAEGALRRGLRKTEILDERRRIERLLERVATPAGSPEMLRQLRMVETLEIIGGTEARKLLEKLATGDADARLTREAKAALARMPTR